MSTSPAAAEGPILPPSLAEALACARAGARAVLCGWLRTARRGKTVGFLHLADGSQVAGVQCVVDPAAPALAAVWPQLTTGASVRVAGCWVACAGREQAWELAADRVELIGAADAAVYPLQKKNHGLDFLRTIPHLRPRAKTFQAAFRIRHCLAQATTRFFASHGFCQVHTPVLTAHDCEGGGQMFAVAGPREKAGGPHFFGVPVQLTVSGQLNGQAMAYGLGRIYTFGPTFRAENSNTTRHLSEFWMVEPEVAFATAADNARLAEAYTKACLVAVLAEMPAELALLGERHERDLAAALGAIVERPVLRLTYAEAVALIGRSGHPFAAKLAWGDDLQAEHEQFLTEVVAHGPVLVVDWPRQLKAFYMYQNDDGRTVAAMDLLVPRIGELIGGSQREHRGDRLADSLAGQGIAADRMRWYLDLHRFGGVPHSGFGLGFERLVMLCTGLTNVRDSIPFPRAPGQASD